MVGIIGISAIIFLVPTDKNKQQVLIKLTRDKLNKQLDFGQLAAMITSFKDNSDGDDLEVEQLNDNTTEELTSIKDDDIQTNPNNTSKTSTIQNTARWGIVSSSKASYYTRKGKFLGHLSPGTALNIVKITQTKKGSIAVCRPFKQSSSDIILINPEHLLFHNSDINNLSKELEHLYVQQAELTAEIATIKKQKAKELRRDNPYARKYAINKKEYHDYWQKVKDLTKKRDAASNAEHLKYADELRSMKGEDIIIANNLKQVKSDYYNWNIAHPLPENSDPKVNKLLTELDRIGNIISSME